jgi:hypothetical protein
MAKPRTLKLTSPPMHGSDVTLLQQDVNAEFSRWNVKHGVPVDGAYGPHTRDAVQTVMYGLGITQSEDDKGITPTLRVKIRRRLLNPAERIRYRARAGWRKRLQARYDGHGPAAALAFAKANVGVTESPPGSNRGKTIDAWEKLCKILGGPWCGCAVNRFLMAGGFPAQPWLRYCPSIEAKAKAGEGGWSWHSLGDAQAGDLILYGSREAKHVGIVDVAPWTYEGNTSSGEAGSQDNGGVVAHRKRDWRAAGFPARGLARPPWKSVA